MADPSSSLTHLGWLIGEWRGYGIVGKQMNMIHKSFRLEVGGLFLLERTLSMFPPSKPTTDYEQHQDLVVYYFDPSVGALKAKGFYIEGFVSSGDVHVSKAGQQIMVKSTQIENGPPNMATRFALNRKGEGEFIAKFEIAWQGVDYELSQKLTMQKIA